MRKVPLDSILSKISRKDNFVFLETNRWDRDNSFSYLFTGPRNIISCYEPKLVEHSIARVEEAVNKGYFAAGFISYEAGFALENICICKPRYDFPLLWFGIFKKPAVFDHREVQFSSPVGCKDFYLDGIKPDISEPEYIRSIENIKRYIEQGQTYQVNRTFKLKFSYKGPLEALYFRLRQKQSVSYSAYVRFQNTAILSFSPELFFRKTKQNMLVKPMKGTMPRGMFLAEDVKNVNLLYNCPKNRSENIMIVDLLRNDLGKISKAATVHTKKFFEIEKYESLFQMTSTIESVIKPRIFLYEIFKSLFPSGSVTGAPKIKTMQIINKIEKQPRNIYTGAIGFIKPNLDSVFNIAIRTILVNTQSREAEMGVGSGIVYDSDAKKEYEECILKSRFLTDSSESFKLVETMLWDAVTGCILLEFHLRRIAESAEYFQFNCNKQNIINKLHKASKAFSKGVNYKVRLLLGERGDLEISSTITDRNSYNMISVSNERTDRSDKWLYHKTTRRSLYDIEHKKYRQLGFFDVVFMNEEGQVTEGAISNIFIEKNNVYYTPPLQCGVLNGVYRRYLLSASKLDIVEKVICYNDLLDAENIIMTNAVTGMVKVKLCSRSVNKNMFHGKQDNVLNKVYAYV